MGRSKGRPSGAAPTPELIDKEQQVVALRREGHTWSEISEQVGYKSPSGSRDAFIRAMQRVLVEDAEDLRALEYDRLEHLHAAHWERAISGDIKSTEVILKIMDRRSKLLALDLKGHKPQTIAASEPSYDATEVQRLVKWYSLLSETNPMPVDFY